VVIKRQLGIVEHKYRINWSQVEFKDKIEDIEHPIVKEALKFFKVDFPIEITTFSDIPGQTGLGSSSSFAVGLVNALHALRGEMVTKHTLASEAAHIEVDLLGRAMGKQDHYAAAYGNFNIFTFESNEVVWVEPVLYRPDVKEKLQRNLMLFYTSLKRDASKILESQQEQTDEKFDSLRQLQALVEPLRDILSKGKDLDQFGEILHQGWLLKRELTDDISSPVIDKYYKKALDAGAIGGKILGAGGGGFFLFYVDEGKQGAVKDALTDLYYLPVQFDSSGTRITYYDE